MCDPGLRWNGQGIQKQILSSGLKCMGNASLMPLLDTDSTVIQCPEVVVVICCVLAYIFLHLQTTLIYSLRVLEVRSSKFKVLVRLRSF